MKSRLLNSALIVTALAFGACASSAKGKKTSAFTTAKSVPQQQLQVQAPEGSILAVVRYPAVVDQSAKDKFREAYLSSPIGGRIKNTAEDAVMAQNMVDSTIVKSNYFALSLYKELVARLPEHSVLLSPHEIKLGPDGELTSVPVTMAESLPSVVTVDFATYSFPDPDRMMNKEPLTFGDLITPIVSVKTDHRAAVPTNGVLLASQPLAEAAVGNGYKTAQADLDELQSGRLQANIPELDFISLLSNEPGRRTATQALSMRAEDNSVQISPLEKIQMDGKTILALDQTNKQGEIDPLQPIFSDGFATRIIDIINDNASEKTAMAKRAAAIATYDPSLAALTYVGSDSPEYQARYNYVNRMLDAEKKYLSVQSLRLFDGVHNGEMGAQVRDMLKAEYAILEKRRELARKQNQATALAVLGAVATGATMGSAPLIMGGGISSTRNDPCGHVRQRPYSSPSQQRTALRSCYSEYERRLREQCQVAVQDGRYPTIKDCVDKNHFRNKVQTRAGASVGGSIFMTGTIYATTQIFAYKQESKAIGRNYLTSIVPALEQQTNVQISLIDSNETITAIRFDDLQDQLKSLYLEKQRSLDETASNCAFNGSGSSTGTWMGVCDGGVANGSGVGVIRRADGSSVEYYGYATNGIPNGPGYMIVYEAQDTYALEGNFMNGQANGDMRVSRAGKPNELREYQAGKDVGRASKNAVISSPFDNVRTGT